MFWPCIPKLIRSTGTSAIRDKDTGLCKYCSLQSNRLYGLLYHDNRDQVNILVAGQFLGPTRGSMFDKFLRTAMLICDMTIHNHPVTKGAQCYIYNIWRNIWIQDLSNYIAQTLCTWLYKADFIMASFAHVSNLAHGPLVLVEQKL